MMFNIVTPTHRTTYIEQAIASIDAQTFWDWEHLIAVDRFGIDIRGSAKHRVLHCMEEHRNWGNSCRDMLIGEASGNWIVYLDDDDRLRPSALSVLSRSIAEHPSLVWGFFGMEYENGPSVPESLTRQNLWKSVFSVGQLFHRRIIDGKRVRFYRGNAYAGDKITASQFLDKEPIVVRKVLAEHPRYNVGQVV